MQCNSTKFTNGCILNFLGFIKHCPACRPAACKKFQQSQLGHESFRKFQKIVIKVADNIEVHAKSSSNFSKDTSPSGFTCLKQFRRNFAIIIVRPQVMGEENHNLCCVSFQILPNLHDLHPRHRVT